MQQVTSGDTFFIYNNNYKVYAARNPYLSSGNDLFGVPAAGETITIKKYNYTYNGSSGTLTSSSGLIYTGDIVTLEFSGGQLLYVTNTFPNIYIDNVIIDTSPGDNQMCQNSASGGKTITDQGDALWTFVTTTGSGYVNDNGSINGSQSPVYYNTNFFIQNIGSRMCNTFNAYEYMQARGVNNNIFNESPVNNDYNYPNGDNTFIFQLVKPQILYSGYYITLLNVYNRQYVYQQGLGGSDNTYGFTSTVSPNEKYSTFLIKKYNTSDGSFYDTSTPIYYGDLFCLFGYGPGGLVGLFQSPPVATNNIICNTGLTVINPNQVCNVNAGANYALYVFVDPATGTGNLSDSSVGTVAINYGQGLYIQSVGQFACQQAVAYLLSGTNISSNLNLSTISGSYPDVNENNSNNFTFVLYNQYLTAFFTTSNPVTSNSCANNPNPFTCTTENDIDCGCQNPYGIGTGLNDLMYFISTYIGIVVIIGIIIFAGIVILIVYEATKKKKPKNSKTV